VIPAPVMNRLVMRKYGTVPLTVKWLRTSMQQLGRFVLENIASVR
jgi:hypothetical protein